MPRNEKLSQTTKIIRMEVVVCSGIWDLKRGFIGTGQGFDNLFHGFLPIGHLTNIECRFVTADIIMLAVGFERMTVGLEKGSLVPRVIRGGHRT